MKTMERTQREVGAPKAAESRTSPGRRMWIVVLVGVLVLIVGAVGGYVARGSDDASDAPIVLAGDGELTARQEQMVELVDASLAAWQQGNGDEVVALFTRSGTVDVMGMTVLHADDGTLAQYVDRGFPTLDIHSPLLVHGNTVLFFHNYGSELLWDVIEFTTSGELLMVRHTMR